MNIAHKILLLPNTNPPHLGIVELTIVAMVLKVLTAVTVAKKKTTKAKIISVPWKKHPPTRKMVTSQQACLKASTVSNQCPWTCPVPWLRVNSSIPTNWCNNKYDSSPNLRRSSFYGTFLYMTLFIDCIALRFHFQSRAYLVWSFFCAFVFVSAGWPLRDSPVFVILFGCWVGLAVWLVVWYN